MAKFRIEIEHNTDGKIWYAPQILRYGLFWMYLSGRGKVNVDFRLSISYPTREDALAVIQQCKQEQIKKKKAYAYDYNV